MSVCCDLIDSFGEDHEHKGKSRQRFNIYLLFSRPTFPPGDKLSESDCAHCMSRVPIVRPIIIKCCHRRQLCPYNGQSLLRYNWTLMKLFVKDRAGMWLAEAYLPTCTFSTHLHEFRCYKPPLIQTTSAGE